MIDFACNFRVRLNNSFGLEEQFWVKMSKNQLSLSRKTISHLFVATHLNLICFTFPEKKTFPTCSRNKIIWMDWIDFSFALYLSCDDLADTGRVAPCVGVIWLSDDDNKAHCAFAYPAPTEWLQSMLILSSRSAVSQCWSEKMEISLEKSGHQVALDSSLLFVTSEPWESSARRALGTALEQEVAKVKLAKHATQYALAHRRISDYRGASPCYLSRENSNLSAMAVHNNGR